MKKELFFINGFGGGLEDAIEIRSLLESEGYDFTYIDLPGHYSAKDVTVTDFEELLAYFEAFFPEHPIVLIGHAIGAEIAAYLSTRLTQIESVIMLDGGIITNEDFNKTFQESIEETEQLFQSAELDDLDEESLIELLKLNDAMKLTIARLDYDTPSLLLLSDFEDELAIKIQRLEKTNNPVLDYKVIPNASHDIYADQPEQTVKMIVEWLEKDLTL